MIFRLQTHLVLVLALCSVAASALAEPIVFLDQAEFLAALSNLGFTHRHEGFENNAVWGNVRGLDQAVALVTSQGLIWTSNNLTSKITTGEGPARTGQFGFFSYPHGSYANPDPDTDCLVPGQCGDGFRGRVEDGMLVAIGGWVDTNTPYASIGLFLGEYPHNAIDFGETCIPPGSEQCTSNATIGTTPKFFGVIDVAGFDRFEYRELEGKLEVDGGDIKYIFADDFYFALDDPERVFGDGFEQSP